MVDINKIEAISALNNEMLEAAYNLEEAIKKKNKTEIEKIKELILSLQKKTSQLLE